MCVIGDRESDLCFQCRSCYEIDVERWAKVSAGYTATYGSNSHPQDTPTRQITNHSRLGPGMSLRYFIPVRKVWVLSCRGSGGIIKRESYRAITLINLVSLSLILLLIFLIIIVKSSRDFDSVCRECRWVLLRM